VAGCVRDYYLASSSVICRLDAPQEALRLVGGELRVLERAVRLCERFAQGRVGGQGLDELQQCCACGHAQPTAEASAHIVEDGLEGRARCLRALVDACQRVHILAECRRAGRGRAWQPEPLAQRVERHQRDEHQVREGDSHAHRRNAPKAARLSRLTLQVALTRCFSGIDRSGVGTSIVNWANSLSCIC